MNEIIELNKAIYYCDLITNNLYENLRRVHLLNLRHNTDYVETIKHYVADARMRHFGTVDINDKPMQSEEIKPLEIADISSSLSCTSIGKPSRIPILKKRLQTESLTTLKKSKDNCPAKLTSRTIKSCSNDSNGNDNVVKRNLHERISSTVEKTNDTYKALDASKCITLSFSSAKINYKFLKVKRGVECLMHQMEHILDCVERQNDESNSALTHLHSCRSRSSRFSLCTN